MAATAINPSRNSVRIRMLKGCVANQRPRMIGEEVEVSREEAAFLVKNKLAELVIEYALHLVSS